MEETKSKPDYDFRDGEGKEEVVFQDMTEDERLVKGNYILEWTDTDMKLSMEFPVTMSDERYLSVFQDILNRVVALVHYKTGRDTE